MVCGGGLVDDSYVYGCFVLMWDCKVRERRSRKLRKVCLADFFFLLVWNSAILIWQIGKQSQKSKEVIARVEEILSKSSNLVVESQEGSLKVKPEELVKD